MRKVAVVTDSNSGITQEEGKALGVRVLPMPFYINGELFHEDITMSQEQFYQHLVDDAEISTSQPAPGEVMDLWDEVLKEYDELVYIPMSSGLSGSCNTAKMLAVSYDGKVQVVDNQRISVTQRQSVLDALELASRGKSAAKICKKLEEMKMDASIYITVDTLKYLKKGGRITPAAAVIGSMLNIKPVLQIQGAKLDKFCQVMSVPQAKKRMIDQIRKDITTKFSNQLNNGTLRVMMAHTNSEQKCLAFKEEAEAALADLGVKVSYVDPLSLSVSCNIGDGAIAIA